MFWQQTDVVLQRPLCVRFHFSMPHNFFHTVHTRIRVYVVYVVYVQIPYTEHPTSPQPGPNLNHTACVISASFSIVTSYKVQEKPLYLLPRNYLLYHTHLTHHTHLSHHSHNSLFSTACKAGPPPKQTLQKPSTIAHLCRECRCQKAALRSQAA